MAIRPLIALVMSTLLLAVPAFADPPRVASASDELRRNLDEVIAKIQSPAFRALETDRRREQIRKITDRLFNWSEMAKRALGDHWGSRTATERRAFADWFAAVAERAYAGSVDNLGARGVPPDAVVYLGEATSGTDALVRTALAYPRELPIDFLMTRRAGRWEVCDIRVDGVSAAENYRAQFQRVIAGGSFPALVERMNTKRGGAASP
jgi:phospholipid transport system substrate-binding protein